VTLLFGSRTEKDIILQDWLREQSLLHPHKLHVHHYLEHPPPSLPPALPPVMLLPGRIDEEAIRKVGGGREGGREGGFGMVFVCGPPPFMGGLSGEKALDKSQGPLEGVLKKLGWKEEEVYKF
jgi:cytochrome-b5 reductase